MCTHEQYIATVRNIVLERAKANGASNEALERAKVVYGHGSGRALRGVTYFSQWKNGEDGAEFVEICAGGEESLTQLAGTTIHELAHVLAGHAAGHGKAWRDACRALGMRPVKAAGTQYLPARFVPELRQAFAALEAPTDGAPVARFGATGAAVQAGPCGAGIGTRGGTSRGKGSGSRQLKVQCVECGCIVRMAQSWIDKAGLPTCGCGGHMVRA